MLGTPLNMINQINHQQGSMHPTNGHMQHMNGVNNGTRFNGNEMPGSNLGFQMNPVSKNSKKKWCM